ncbi:uncharacterized protein MYCFIDRAFT_79331 [Pseudocercospora fijiensis CIRAD86]|uniref:DUF7730 domain-containing protein n=1 Tax=Pseudocercospora fijiensis (strain CIRAD86) TaxID=383855 RepID=M3ALT2_PSEFD|nr:uncharacterized protein MYCFIDRAFT_79331 [Pseudocercospora fijiensis CIRAD86]EME78108.1 hypothetical protein MYCFIDRAFT_79331 [Pseudocercospora fijiensis CIRAD86]
MKDPKASPNTFHFLNLPPELRNRIYDINLSVGRPVVLNAVDRDRPFLACCVSDSERDSNAAWSRSCFNPKLLLTCRKINLEATKILYGNNTFSCTLIWRFVAWLESIGGSVVHVRKVDVGSISPLMRSWLPTNATPDFDRFLEVLQDATELEQMILDAKEVMSIWPNPPDAAEKFRGFLLAVKEYREASGDVFDIICLKASGSATDPYYRRFSEEPVARYQSQMRAKLRGTAD